MERSQKKIHRKDDLTWPANILTCSPHVLSHVLALNGTSLLAVTCPCNNQAGWPFWCPYRNMFFFQFRTVHRETNSEKPQVKIRFAFHFVERNNHDDFVTYPEALNNCIAWTSAWMNQKGYITCSYNVTHNVKIIMTILLHIPKHSTTVLHGLQPG